MHQKGGDLNRDRRVARPGGWLDQVAKTLLVKYQRDLLYLSGLILRNRLRWRAKLLWIFDRFLSLRYFGEICIEAQAFLIKKLINPNKIDQHPHNVFQGKNNIKLLRRFSSIDYKILGFLYLYMGLYRPYIKVLTLLTTGISTLTKLILDSGGDNAILRPLIYKVVP